MFFLGFFGFRGRAVLGASEKLKNRQPENLGFFRTNFESRPPADGLCDWFSACQNTIGCTLMRSRRSRLVTYSHKHGVEQAIDRALDFLHSSKKNIVLKQEQKGVITALLSGNHASAVLPVKASSL